MVLIALEAASVFILILPGRNKNLMFEALRNGNGDEASDLYGKVKFFAAKDIEDDIKGFLITETNGYLKGQNSYDEFASRVSAVEKIDDYKGSSFEYMKAANLTQLTGLYEKGYTEKAINSGNNLFDIWDDFDDVYNIYDKNGKSLTDNYGSKSEEYFDYIDSGLDDYLKEKYEAFKSGNLDAAAITAYTDVALEFFVDTDYANKVNSEIAAIAAYEKELELLNSMMAEKDYFGVISRASDDISKYENEMYFENYKEQFKSIYDEAYSTGMKEGLEKAKADAEAGKKKEARDEVAELKQIFGDDVDTTAIENIIVPEWARGYIAFIADLGGQFNAVMAKGPEIYMLAGKNDKEKSFDGPAKHTKIDTSAIKNVWLEDIDGNGIPELMLSADETPHYIFTWSGGEVIVLLDCGWVKKIGDGGYVYTTADHDVDDKPVKYDMLWQINEKEAASISVAIMNENDGEKLYVVDSNSSKDKVDEEKYNAAVENITGKCQKDISGGTDISNYKDFIELY